MVSRRTHRIINALALLVGGICVSGVCSVATLMVAPGLAFSHSSGDGRIIFHATRPLSRDAANHAAAEAWSALQGTYFGVPDHPIDVYVTGGDGWRHGLFFAPARWASGLTYPLLSGRNVFLREVDLDAGRMVGATGPVEDPRTLTYYLVHEISHLRHGEEVGVLAFLRTPNWVREGLSDLAALGPAPDDLIERALAGEDLGRDRYGSYPLERVCVTIALARSGIGIADLLDTRAPMHSPDGCDIPRPSDSD